MSIFNNRRFGLLQITSQIKHLSLQDRLYQLVTTQEFLQQSVRFQNISASLPLFQVTANTNHLLQIS